MSDLEKQFEKLAREIEFDDTPDSQHRDMLERFLVNAHESRTPRFIKFWRTIMKSQASKFAAAAMFLIAAGLAITFINTPSKAWAVEDSIAALEPYNAIALSGSLYQDGEYSHKDGEKIKFDAWMRANEDQSYVDCMRMELDNGMIEVVFQSQRKRYYPESNTVSITEGYKMASLWLGASLLEQLREVVLDWQETYGKDPATGRERVFITCRHPAAPKPRSWWFEIDLNTNLLVKFKQWNSVNREGIPAFSVESITYLESLPDETFTFKAPESATVTTPEFISKLLDPDVGMLIDSISNKDAARMITEMYWNAVLENDCKTSQKLYPIGDPQQISQGYSQLGADVIEIGEPRPKENCEHTISVPCAIRFQGETTKEIIVNVLFRNIDGHHSCVIISHMADEF